MHSKQNREAYRLPLSIVELLRARVNGTALDLVGPSSIVPETVNSFANVAPRTVDGLSVVHRLNRRQFLMRLLHQGDQLKQVFSTVGGSLQFPRAVQCLASGSNGNVDILFFSFADGADFLL